MPLRACLCASRGGVPRLHAALTTMIGHTRARPCRFRVASGCCRRMAQWHYCSDLCAHKRRFAHPIIFRTRPSHMLGGRMPGCAKCRGSPRHTNCSRTLAWVRTAAARSLGYALMPWRIGGRPRLKRMRESPASPEARDAAFEAIVTTSARLLAIHLRWCGALRQRVPRGCPRPRDRGVRPGRGTIKLDSQGART